MKLIQYYKSINFKGRQAKVTYAASAFFIGFLSYIWIYRPAAIRERHYRDEALGRAAFELQYPELKDKYVDPLSKRLPKP